MSKTEMKKKIQEDPDFIYCPSADNSLEQFMKKHPNGVSEEKIAQVMMMTTEEVAEAHQKAVEKIRMLMKVGEE